ncbi:MAG: hypothetical protein JO065_06240 [Acidobacteria bacterium]|nr:hypothetical protein [Acidobacteriota bacterium]MBV9435907.1 hypothetical protein [Acidobacteriota bacterium]
MGPIETLYRDFCERIARDCEAEAERYEEHPQLEDRDRQFVSVLRERAKRLRQEISRIDSDYAGRAS